MRIIGIRHRIKRSATGEARPTLVAILEDGEPRTLELASEVEELDWVLGRLPSDWRDVTPEDDVLALPRHHVRWKKLADPTAAGDYPTQHVLADGGLAYVATKVPSTYDGLRADDLVAMALGGSGDYFAYAIKRRSDEIGARIKRIPPFVLKAAREGSKDDDAVLLITLVREHEDTFIDVSPRDLQLIRLRNAFRVRHSALKARKGCQQRLRQLFIGRVFCTDEGGYPEGDLEKGYAEEEANDRVLKALESEESRRTRELTKIVEEFDVYQQVFQPIEGCGPVIAAGIITAVGDIRLYPTVAKFKAACGVHVGPEGEFIRRREGQIANWSGDARQALYEFADQGNRRPNSVWGQRFRQIKKDLRAKHPEPVKVPKKGPNGKERVVTVYSPAHILKMAKWRTATKFAEHIYREWWKVEERQADRRMPVVAAS